MDILVKPSVVVVLVPVNVFMRVAGSVSVVVLVVVFVVGVVTNRVVVLSVFKIVLVSYEVTVSGIIDVGDKVVYAEVVNIVRAVAE